MPGSLRCCLFQEKKFWKALLRRLRALKAANENGIWKKIWNRNDVDLSGIMGQGNEVIFEHPKSFLVLHGGAAGAWKAPTDVSK